MKKTVILLTTGTRGDVQPFIALGLELQAAGVPTCLATDPAFAGLAQTYGLPLIPVEGNPSALMTQSGRQALTIEGSLVGSLRASLAYLRAARPCYRRMLENAWRACQGGGALVIGLPSLWGAHIAEALKIPCIYAFQQPFTRTTAYPSALLPLGLLPSGAAFNRLSHLLIEQAVWQPWRDLINDWRRASLGLPRAPLAGIAGRMYDGSSLVLSAVSALVVPPPADQPKPQHTTGFWFLDPPPGWQAPAELLGFLRAGPPPLYVGFGSPGPREQRSAALMILQAAQICGMRMVSTLPADAFPAGSLGERVFCLSDVPHAWLFPHCAAVVHHGGAGTTAAALRAGLPALVIPRATDQFFWGERIHALNCGPSPLPQRTLTSAKLAERMAQLRDNSIFKIQAGRLGAALRVETGVQNAARLLLEKLA